ncbi:hypothetical protein [Kineococcus sp. SYSU DK003]|uniref:hypothetical protein n=1 Tax=Kineococcus sp. SYSU DK003 TaxID=3383124 RepID=UPI003D7D17EA
MPRINTRRALAVGATSLAALTLLPLLADARPTERTILLVAALPAAAVFGYLAGYIAAPVEDPGPGPASTPAPGRTPSPPAPTVRSGQTPPLGPEGLQEAGEGPPTSRAH